MAENFGPAIEYSNKAIVLSEKLNYKSGLVRAHNNLGVVYYHLGNYPESLKNHFVSFLRSGPDQTSSVTGSAKNEQSHS